MQHMVSDLLRYSRVGTRGGAFEATDCNEVLKEALENLKMVVDESHAEVSSGELPTVNADRSQLMELLQNLVGNAIKFRSDDPLRVRVAAERGDGEWLFSVRDNGIGMDPEQSERIFKLFYRVHGRRDYPGTGMGLAICRRIVERHGGKIWVQSAPGAGSTLYFTLPDMESRQAACVQPGDDGG
jgi:light-regulated signal transduction histidine kinase (bacteriophytochrome)